MKLKETAKLCIFYQNIFARYGYKDVKRDNGKFHTPKFYHVQGKKIKEIFLSHGPQPPPAPEQQFWESHWIKAN